MSLHTYGMPRVGDKEYAANHDRLVNNSWRVVHYKDPVSHLPMCNILTGCGLTDGPYHHRTEVYYPSPDMTQNSEYIICKGNEDNNCSNGAVSEDTVPVKNQQHIPLFSEDPKLFFSEKER